MVVEVEDLRKFLVVSNSNNLQVASETLHITPSALSKVIKRLESQLNTALFNRQGRNIVLNSQGEKFKKYAKSIVYETDQVISEYKANQVNHINISGPSILLRYWLPMLLKKMVNFDVEITTNTCWEGDAVSSLRNGKSHLAVVTNMVENTGADVIGLPLAETTFHIVASKKHPIFTHANKEKITLQKLKFYAFACPNLSPFCGIKRGEGSDGWRDDKVARNIKYICDDFSLLLSLVEEGVALAYMPDFIAKQIGLCVVDIDGLGFNHKESIQLLYSPSQAEGWLSKLVDHIKMDREKP